MCASPLLVKPARSRRAGPIPERILGAGSGGVKADEGLISPEFTAVFKVCAEREEMLPEAGPMSARAWTFG
jgi:hypothetical protein